MSCAGDLYGHALGETRCLRCGESLESIVKRQQEHERHEAAQSVRVELSVVDDALAAFEDAGTIDPAMRALRDAIVALRDAVDALAPDDE